MGAAIEVLAQETDSDSVSVAARISSQLCLPIKAIDARILSLFR